MESTSASPPLPTVPYTACYCEENVYLLGDALTRLAPQDSLIYAVVISNADRSAAIWEQKASANGAQSDFLCIWDYHVVLCYKSRASSDVWIYDVDSRLGSPCPWQRYVDQTFKALLILSDEDVISKRFRCQFRVVPIRDYLDNFSSDRSHMLTVSSDPSARVYHAPPPSYPAITGPGALATELPNNLMSHFVDMSFEGIGYGTVLEDTVFLKDVSWMENCQRSGS
ncbi:hypothetical protein FRB94_002021 [Tulasnella sp. JGI-2019a]|nr:hypothetical protein FRB93_003754 [Tulasnella sp. JGI-2019a]KAG9004853.1 hypothetical protein FRB94_002021 [Tulasnella sp. JGI-2019a]KAG9032136.1 hypothetical protein FRB95_001842 [Tulasnella sp. JGI-2019a]